jgi:hypothetical protein
MTDVNRPLDLKLAAAISGYKLVELRQAREAGKLLCWKPGGRWLTTIADIDDWTQRCRADARRPGSISIKSETSGLYETDTRSKELGAQQKLAMTLKDSLRSISAKNTNRRQALIRS